MSGVPSTTDLAVDTAAASPRRLWPLALWMLQIAVPLKVMNDFREPLPHLAHAATVAMLLIVAAAFWPVTRESIDRFRKQLALAWCSALLTLMLLEAALSTLYANNVIELFASKTSMMVYEQSQQTVVFDALRGYRLRETPARFMRFTETKPEYVGTLEGNAQGFPDRDDFSPQKNDPQKKRFAVFGDSFTAAQYIETNWPERAEELAAADGIDIELYNFAVDGGGLINWWSVITKLLEPDNYEFDGVIFAVYPGDLSRRFIVSDHTSGQSLLGRASSWDVKKLPTTLDEAMPYMEPHGVIVDAPLFEGILNGTSRQQRHWLPYLLTNYYLWRDDLTTEHRARVVEQRLEDHPARHFYVDAIRAYVESRKLPVVVVHIPRKHLAAGHNGRTGMSRNAERFAKTLAATVVDGTQAYDGLDDEALAACWFDFDPHWTQAGSDRFAAFMAEELKRMMNDER